MGACTNSNVYCFVYCNDSHIYGPIYFREEVKFCGG